MPLMFYHMEIHNIKVLKRNWKLNQPTYLDYSYSMIFPANNKNQYPVRKTAFAHALRAVIRFQAHYKRSVCAIQYAKICLYQSPTEHVRATVGRASV